MQPTQPPLETLLFFGSPFQQTYLTPTSSHCLPYAPTSFLQLQTPNTLLQALIYRFSLDFLGFEYKGLYLPCTPAHEILLTIPETDFIPCNSDTSKGILDYGFIKTDQKTEFPAYRSGKRSAIYWDIHSSRFFRLKGCGNNERGFESLIGMVNLSTESKEIRGCHYSHTVKRELLMTDKINKFLTPLGFESGNKPIGFYLYGEIPNNLDNSFAKIPKFCGVFETLGEKRVATHLFQGFEALLLEFIRFSEIKFKIKEVFPKERLENDGKYNNTPVDMDGKAENEVLLDIFSLLDQKELSWTLDEQTKIMFLKALPEIIENLQIKPLFSDIFTSIFNEIFQKDELFLLNDLLGLAGLLYARIGFEIGRIKRIFIDKRINWGYYFDHHPFLAHCNAHPNNFIVLQEGNIGENLLAPLDFDLAFEEKEFININYEDKNYGERDEKLFNEMIDNERVSLELALTGIENMDNFEYYSLKLKGLEGEKENDFDGIKVLLRDCLRRFYLIGMDMEKEFKIKGFEWKKQSKLYSIIKLSLIITNECMG